MHTNATEDLSYHGIHGDVGGNRLHFRLFLEPTHWTPISNMRLAEPVQRQELRHPSDNDFGWGYNGHGTSRTAATILQHALGETPSDLLREDFCLDVVAHLTDMFYLRQGAVLRWARGWFAQHPSERMPAALSTLPPVDLGTS
jgi:hypothetical protein